MKIFEKGGTPNQNVIKCGEKKAKRKDRGMVEFILKLRDRHGRERELCGLVEEGTTRNDAVAKLVMENGGVCEIREGEKELAGLRWISRIEFGDGFRIEEWGQYATMDGEFEIGKANPSLMDRMLAAFFRKFRERAFWENGDTKRITKKGNKVLFREDYGVDSELPQAEAMLRSGSFRPGGGCGGEITKGELELVKLAARMDFKREEYLVNLDGGKIRKRDDGCDLPYAAPRTVHQILARPESLLFDAREIADLQSRHEIIRHLDDPKKRYVFDYAENPDCAQNLAPTVFPCGIIQHEDIGFIGASPDLFFSRYEKESLDFAKEENGKDKEEHGGAAEQAKEETNEEEDLPESEGQEDPGGPGAKNRQKKQAWHESRERHAAQGEEDKILSIIRKLKNDKEEKREGREKPIAGNTIDEGKEKNKKENKEPAEKKTEKQSSSYGKRRPENKRKRAKKNERSEIRVPKINEKPSNVLAGKSFVKKAAKERQNAKPREKPGKVQGRLKLHKESKSAEKGNKEKAVKIRLKKITIRKRNELKLPKKHSNPKYRKGAELAHRIFLKALRGIERKRKARLLLVLHSGQKGKLSSKKPGNKV